MKDLAQDADREKTEREAVVKSAKDKAKAVDAAEKRVAAVEKEKALVEERVAGLEEKQHETELKLA